MEKLTKSNYLLWHAQIMPAIRAACLEGFIDGSEKKPVNMLKHTSRDTVIEEENPAYALWITRDQSVLGYLLSSLTREVLTSVSTLTSSIDVWRTLADMYASRSHARSVQTHLALTTTRKGAQSVAEYFSKMRGHTNELATTGAPLSDEEFVSYVLASLHDDFDSMVSVVVARVEPISPTDLYSQMLAHELHRERHPSVGNHGSYSSANAATCGCGGPGRFNRHGRGHGHGGQSSGNNTNSRALAPCLFDSSGHPHCQVCLQPGHTANICWYHFDEEYVPEQKTAAAAVSMTHSSDL
jgi:hypothetical protein